MFEIKKGIARPEKSKRIYPFLQMVVGDCFDIVTLDKAEATKKQSSVGRSLPYYIMNGKVDSSFKISTSVLQENGKFLVRVWRIA